MVKNTTDKTTTTFENRQITEQRFKGVRKRKWGKWVSEIRLPNSRERIWLGSYDSAEKAARAFDAAMYCLRGSKAKFNFPDNPPDIPDGQSLTPMEIQQVAARFANAESSARGESDMSVHGIIGMGHAEYSQSASSSALSEGNFFTVESESESRSFVNMLTKMDSGNFVSDFGMFPGFDDMNLGNDFNPPEYYNGEDDFDVNIDTFLWNF